jgi:hypothetical protein
MRVMGRLLEHVHGGRDIGECGLWSIISCNNIGNLIVYRTIEHALIPSIYLNTRELFWIYPSLLYETNTVVSLFFCAHRRDTHNF